MKYPGWKTDFKPEYSAMKTNRTVKSFRYTDLFAHLFLIIIILIVFGQITGHEFINFDDDIYVTNNIHVKAGLSSESVAWALTTMKAEFWHPLTWLSLMLDTQLYGVKAGGYLFSGLLLHIFSTLFLFGIFKNMTGSVWNSGLVAALFAIHPLHVEPVAWIAARKDVLSTFFMMLTVLCYLRYVKKPGMITYLSVCLCFMAGLMSKPMLVTLPFVLLLLDYWPLERAGTNGGITFSRVKALVWEKTPLLFLSAAASALAVLAQKAGGGIGTMQTYPFSTRIANSLVSYVGYLSKTVWPRDLAFFYPFHFDFSAARTGVALTVVVLLTLLSLKLWKRCPYLIVGWLWYLGTLLPVIGLVKIGGAAMADRYTYIPLIGIFMMISWGVSDLLKHTRWEKAAFGVFSILLIIQFMAIARIQTGYWSDSTRLFEHAIQVTEDNYMAHNNLGNIKFRQDKIHEAMVHYAEALRIRPDFPEALNGMGASLVRSGRIDASIDCFQQALRLTPDNTIIRNNLKKLKALQKSRGGAD